MKTSDKLNWSLIFKLKEVRDYLTHSDLINICLDKEIRNRLVPYIFSKLHLGDFGYKNETDNVSDIRECYVDFLETQLNELKSGYNGIDRYTESLKLLGGQLYDTSLIIPSLFPRLNHLLLFNIKVQVSAISNILKNIPSLEYLKLKEVTFSISSNSESGKGIVLPKNLKTLDISELKTIGEAKSTVFLHLMNLDWYKVLKPQKLSKIKNFIINSGNIDELGFVKLFLSINRQTISSLTINEKIFDPSLLAIINNCKNLIKLQLDNIVDIFPLIDNETVYPKFTHIQKLLYKPVYDYNNPYPANMLRDLLRDIDFIQFNLPLIMSFPNLTYFEYLYVEEFEDDLVDFVSSLSNLEKLKLINSKSENNINFDLTSTSLKTLILENILSLNFNLKIGDNCPDLEQISLVDYSLNESNIIDAEAHFNQFENWKTVIFPSYIRMYSIFK